MEGGAEGRSKKSFIELSKNDLIYHHIDSYKEDNKNATITLTKKAISNVTIDTGAIERTLGDGTFCFLVTFIQVLIFTFIKVCFCIKWQMLAKRVKNNGRS